MEIENPISDASNKKPNPLRWVKFVLLFVVLATLITGGIAYYYYDLLFGAKLAPLTDDVLVQIPRETDLDGICHILRDKKILKNKSAFLAVAARMKFKGKSGQYLIPKSSKSHYDLVRILRGEQEPVNFTFNSFRKKEQLAGLASRLLQIDSTKLANLMNDDSLMTSYGFNKETAVAMFIPNSYHIYWDIDEKELMDRMHKEYERFWTKERKAKAIEQGLSPVEVSILASIVETETTHNPEKPKVAGVYLNRLRTAGWKLEADPTVVFANGDFSVRRVTKKLLEIDSPYNTYKYPGLPPGPIYMASVTSIDAVLNAEKHDLWFFCAKVPVEGEPNSHAFAKTNAQHEANARAYQRWLNQQKIYK